MTGSDHRGTLAAILLLGCQASLLLLGAVIHVWTIVLAHGTSGLLAAVVSLLLPFLAQIYWFFTAWSMAGTVANPYCLAILAWIGLSAGLLLGVAWMLRRER